jgi:hypothetical protein
MTSGSYIIDNNAYLILPNTLDLSSLTLGTSNFTIEAWVYLNNYTNVNMIISRNATDRSSLPNGTSWFLGVKDGTGRLYFGFSVTDYLATTGPIVPLNEWTHVSWTRSGTTFTVRVNGGSPVTQVLSTNLTASGDIRIGRGRDNSANYLDGKISNLRVVVNDLIYSSNFTPPTAPLSVTTTTELLTANEYDLSSDFLDDSSNGFTFTTSGTIYKTIITPFLSPDSTINETDQTTWSTTTFLVSGSIQKKLAISLSDALVYREIANPGDAYSET